MTRKMDRFERAAKKAMQELSRCACDGSERATHIEYLIEHPLRSEHLWMRKLVMHNKKKWTAKLAELKRQKKTRLAVYHFIAGAYEDILTRLTQRRG